MLYMILLVSGTLALSPEEFKNHYLQTSPTIQNQYFGQLFPQNHLVRPTKTSSADYRPQSISSHGRPFPNHKDFLHPGTRVTTKPFIGFNVGEIYQTDPVPLLRPLIPRPKPPTPPKPLLLSGDVSLIKLRKIYSKISQNRPTTPPRFAIPPEYIRNSMTTAQTSFGRRSKSPYRKAKRHPTHKVLTYFGPNNKSIIFSTRVEAGIEVNKEEDRPFSSLMNELNYEHPIHSTENNRPKRFSFNDKILKVFRMDLIGKQCDTEKGDIGGCLDIHHCFLINGIPKASENCRFGVCCIHVVNSCDKKIRANNTIWESPPNEEQEANNICPLEVAKISTNICQIRLDMKEFKLQDPMNGSCLQDRFFVRGQNVNSVIPSLCGTASGQHIYIDVDNATGPIGLTFITVGEFKRKWRIQISQIECNNPNRPPRNCLRYYTNTSGTFRSLSTQNENSQYLNNLNYAICIRKQAGLCSIQYEVPSNASFSLVNFDNGLPTVNEGNAGVGSVDCPDDYIVIAGNRLCGDRLNDGSSPSMSENSKVQDSTNGPFIVQVKTDTSQVSQGFQLNYLQIPCS